MLDKDTRDAIREAFLTGQLQVKAVDPDTRVVGMYPVTDVLRHHTPHKRMLRLVLEDGRTIDPTEDHSVFTGNPDGIFPVASGTLAKGDPLVVVDGVEVGMEPLSGILELPPCEHTYDLSVPGPENFVLSNGILAHNSYSIGGVSLEIERASKYESLKQNAEGQFEKATEAKARTVKFIRGLQQPRFGLGVRSSFGPYVGRGVLSPRSFVVLPLFLGLSTIIMSLMNLGFAS